MKHRSRSAARFRAMAPLYYRDAAGALLSESTGLGLPRNIIKGYFWASLITYSNTQEKRNRKRKAPAIEPTIKPEDENTRRNGTQSDTNASIVSESMWSGMVMIFWYISNQTVIQQRYPALLCLKKEMIVPGFGLGRIYNKYFPRGAVETSSRHSQTSEHVWFFLNLFSKRPREKKEKKKEKKREGKKGGENECFEISMSLFPTVLWLLWIFRSLPRSVGGQ